MKSIDERKILTILMCSLPICFQLASITGNSIMYKIVYILISGLFLISNILLPLGIKRSMIIFIIVYLICPLLSFNIKLETLLYFVLVVSFIISCYVGGVLLKGNKGNIIKYLVITNAIPLVYQIIINIEQINARTLMGVFNGDRTHRAIFGYSHSNFAALFIVFEIILIYIWIKEEGNSILKSTLLIICVVPLFATGSRSAVYCLCAFFALNFILIISSGFKGCKNLVYVFLLVLCASFILFNYGQDLINESSGRKEYLMNNLEVIKQNGSLLLGSGGGSISNINQIKGIRYSDNWYITTIINNGLIGLILMLFFLIYIFIGLLRSRSNDKITISLFIMLCIYSLSENIIFVPGICLSWFLWTYIIYFKYYEEKV